MAVVLLLVTGVTRAEAGPTLVREKDVNLDEALRLTDILRRAGYEVTLTRSTDVFIPLVTRARRADGADIFVSVHNNASRNAAAQGTEVYSQLGNNLGAELARSVLGAVTARTGTRARGAFTRTGSHGDDFYSVLRNSRATALIFEGAFLSNPAEARLLADPAFRQRLTEGVAAGIDAVLWTKLAPQATGPPAPRSTPLGPLLLPPAATAAAHTGGGTAALRWDAVPLATIYEVWRDGVLLVRTPDTTVADVGLGAGVHRYQVRAATEALGSVVQESPVSTADVAVPWRVVVDAGHGGKDAGAVGRI
jgi:N-acetylmuramoyl-L-alanine amidase